MIYTTYFAMLKKLPYDIKPIAISLSVPSGTKCPQYKLLAPSWDILKEYKENGMNQEVYVKRFKEEVLGNLDKEGVMRDLYMLSGHAKDIALVCYEKPDDFCHRHIVAKWLDENAKEWHK